MRRGSLLVPTGFVLLVLAPGAAAEPRPEPLDTDLLSPLSVAVWEHGGIWYPPQGDLERLN